jgi:hypothetical protein
MKTKRCGGCSAEKSTSEFHVRRRKGCRDSLQSRCKACQLASHNRWKEKNRQKYLADRKARKASRIAAGSDEIRRQVLSKYRLSVEAYGVMLAAQGGVCAICRRPETARNQHGPLALSVDHDHKTGRIRGLLCRSCNTLLGLSRENCSILESATNYLVCAWSIENREYWAKVSSNA